LKFKDFFPVWKASIIRIDTQSKRFSSQNMMDLFFPKFLSRLEKPNSLFSIHFSGNRHSHLAFYENMKIDNPPSPPFRKGGQGGI
jgi:hypothetical protein